MPCDSVINCKSVEMELSMHLVYVNEILSSPILKKMNDPETTLLDALTDFQIQTSIDTMFSHDGMTDEEINEVAKQMGTSGEMLKKDAERALQEMLPGIRSKLSKIYAIIPPQIAKKMWGGSITGPVFVGTLSNLESKTSSVDPATNEVKENFVQQFTISTNGDVQTKNLLSDYLTNLESRVDNDEVRTQRRRKEWANAAKKNLEKLKDRPGYIQSLLKKVNNVNNDKRIDNLKVIDVKNTKVEFRDFSQVKNPECDFTAVLTAEYEYEVINLDDKDIAKMEDLKPKPQQQQRPMQDTQGSGLVNA